MSAWRVFNTQAERLAVVETTHSRFRCGRAVRALNSRSRSSIQALDRLGRRGHITDDSAEILFQCFLQETIASSSGVSRNVHSQFDVVRPAFPLPIKALPEGWF